MKKLTRKEFLHLTLASSVAIPILGYGCSGGRGKNEPSGGPGQEPGTFYDTLGFQVYTLRNLLVDNASSLFTALARAKIKYIEFYDPLTLNTYVPIVKENGMNPLATHFSASYVTGKWHAGEAPPKNYGYEDVVEDCAANGIRYMGIAYLNEEERQSLDDYKKFAELANACGEKSRASGVQLYYHNHSFEFEPVEGTTPYAEMLKIFDSDLVKLELDVFWAAVAGTDPARLLEETSGRVLFLHLKDLKKGFTRYGYTTDIPEDSFVELGDGILDLRGILTAAKEAGIRIAIIDQDATQMKDKIASVRKNAAYIKALGI